VSLHKPDISDLKNSGLSDYSPADIARTEQTGKTVCPEAAIAGELLHYAP
jgi:hypothetical protein